MTAPGRRSSTFTRLLRHGFTDPSAAERLLEGAELAPVRSDPVLLDALGATADPDLALIGLVRLVEAQDGPPAQRELLDTLIANTIRSTAGVKTAGKKPRVVAFFTNGSFDGIIGNYVNAVRGN